jgi:hypothetical protein
VFVVAGKPKSSLHMPNRSSGINPLLFFYGITSAQFNFPIYCATQTAP